MRTNNQEQVTEMKLLVPLETSLQVLVSAYPRMTLLQMKVFTAIASGQTTVPQVAESTGRHRNTIYKAVDTLSIGKNLTLQNLGLRLVHSTIDGTDTHRRALSLTPKGLEVISDIVSAMETPLSTPQLKTHTSPFKWLVGALSSWLLFGSRS
tara:strand:- start:1648 stop:2103 length:456 start_codon:yes stop_codon:yes gene_type:complete